MSRPDAEKQIELIVSVIARNTPGGDLSDREALSLIIRILETGRLEARTTLRVIDGDHK